MTVWTKRQTIGIESSIWEQMTSLELWVSPCFLFQSCSESWTYSQYYGEGTLCEQLEGSSWRQKSTLERGACPQRDGSRQANKANHEPPFGIPQNLHITKSTNLVKKNNNNKGGGSEMWGKKKTQEQETSAEFFFYAVSYIPFLIYQNSTNWNFQMNGLWIHDTEILPGLH